MARLLRIHPENPQPKNIQAAVEVLRNGGLVIYPTDTVYGMCCDSHHARALEQMAHLKNVKPEKAHFSFVCASLSMVSGFIKQINTTTFRTLKKALPGPYTFILEGNSELPKHFKRRKTVGFRVPNHKITNVLVEALGRPLVSTSIHDKDTILEYSTDPELMLEFWNQKVDLVIDGGYGNNTPSTIVDLTTAEPLLIREGLGAWPL